MALQTHEKLACMHQRLLPQACSLCTQDVNLGWGAILPFVLQLRLAGRNIFDRFLRACGPLAVATSMCLLVSRFLSGSYQGPTAQGDISIITTRVVCYLLVRYNITFHAIFCTLHDYTCVCN